jgi:hypothetical protein
LTTYPFILLSLALFGFASLLFDLALLLSAKLLLFSTPLLFFLAALPFGRVGLLTKLPLFFLSSSLFLPLTALLGTLLLLSLAFNLPLLFLRLPLLLPLTALL